MLRMMAMAVAVLGLSQAVASAADGPDLKAESIKFNYFTKGGRKYVEVVGTVRNVGNRPLSAFHRSHEVRLYEGRTLRATTNFGSVPVRGTIVVKYVRLLTPADGVKPPTFLLRIDYEPDTAYDVNYKNNRLSRVLGK